MLSGTSNEEEKEPIKQIPTPKSVTVNNNDNKVVEKTKPKNLGASNNIILQKIMTEKNDPVEEKEKVVEIKETVVVEEKSRVTMKDTSNIQPYGKVPSAIEPIVTQVSMKPTNPFEKENTKPFTDIKKVVNIPTAAGVDIKRPHESFSPVKSPEKKVSVEDVKIPVIEKKIVEAPKLTPVKPPLIVAPHTPIVQKSYEQKVEEKPKQLEQFSYSNNLVSDSDDDYRREVRTPIPPKTTPTTRSWKSPP